MYVTYYSRLFKRSVKKILRSGKVSREEIEFVISKLAAGDTLDRRYFDHALIGDMAGYRDCHIRPDILLLYSIDSGRLLLLLVDIGSHSTIFEGS